MKTLFKNGILVNVFTGELENVNVLIEDETIVGVGAYTEADADIVEEIAGKYITPGFIDGHIHIESTMLTPSELARVVLCHGTTSIVADPHEIANVCGAAGIEYMLEASENLPLTVYFMLPSCVPPTPNDESGANLLANDLEPYYSKKRVLGLAEMMNYYGVINHDTEVMRKIESAYSRNMVIDGHAPLLSGKKLDQYLTAHIQSDHECSTFEEAVERIRKGQWVMIRQGTAARNLEGLIDLFDEPYCQRCLLVTDDRHPADLLRDGQIDNMLRIAGKMGKSIVTAIQMATIRAAQYFGLKYVGAVAPGYRADLLILNDLTTVEVESVYTRGKKVVSGNRTLPFASPKVCPEILERVEHSFHIAKVSEEDFDIPEKSPRVRIIKTIPQQLITEEQVEIINWEENNGVNVEKDILKIAVLERHKNTGHKGLGFISGIGLQSGAVCSSVSHDSHNIVVIGTNNFDMATAVNRIIDMGGGAVCVKDGKILAEMALPVAGLMTEENAELIAEKNERLQTAIYSLGVPANSAPLMTMQFIPLDVIPDLKMTTRGLVDVNEQRIVSLYVV